MKPEISQEIINLYDEYTHTPVSRRVFMQRLAQLTGGTAAAAALLPFLENNYAQAQMVAADDARLTASDVRYTGSSGEMRAYLVKPRSATGKLPGVVVIHENRGLNTHIRDVARRVALEGFLVLAPDGLSPLGGYPGNDQEAGTLFQRLDAAVTVRNFVASVDYLDAHADCTGKVGCVGFCWGGGMSNLLAINAAKLDAAVAYYGPVPSAADVAKIKVPLLLHYASLDTRINEGVPGYENALKAASVKYTKHMYEGVNHAFNNDTNAARYDKAAADLAWQRTIAFFRQSLQG